MLVPHGREDAEFGEGRFTPDEIENALVFLGLCGTGQQPVPPDAQREMSASIRPASGEVDRGP
jgi:hypothetical protein